MSLGKKIELNYKTHFHPKNYDKNLGKYTVQAGDTIYSILKGISDIEKYPDLEKYSSNIKYNLKAGDKVSIKQGDSHTFYVDINDEEFVINLKSEGSDIEKTAEQARQTLSSLQSSVLAMKGNIEKYTDPTLSTMQSVLQAMLNEGVSNLSKLNEYQATLLGPNYKNNPEAKKMLLLVNVLQLSSSSSTRQIKKTIAAVFDNKDIPYIQKVKVANYLSNYFLGSFEKQKKGLVIAKSIFESYPKYAKQLKFIKIADNSVNGYTCYDIEEYNPSFVDRLFS